MHVSSHLVGPLRHVELSLTQEQPERDLIETVRLTTGTIWHQILADELGQSRVIVVNETTLDDGLPQGWTGRADFNVYIPSLLKLYDEDARWRVIDFKTCRPEKIPYLIKEGIQEEHFWQASSYHMAFSNLGFDVDDEVSVYYLPLFKSGNPICNQSLLLSANAIDPSTLWATMCERRDSVEEFLVGKRELSPIPERQQKLFKVGDDAFDLKLVPHWSAKYCRYEGCGCNTVGTTKIGSFRNGVYRARDGYQTVSPEVFP